MNKTKKKKQLTEVQETLFYELAFWKGLSSLYRAYARLGYYLMMAGLIRTPD